MGECIDQCDIVQIALGVLKFGERHFGARSVGGDVEEPKGDAVVDRVVDRT